MGGGSAKGEGGSEEESDEEEEDPAISSYYLANIGRVVWAENTDKKSKVTKIILDKKYRSWSKESETRPKV
jgi:hypothetical protein